MNGMTSVEISGKVLEALKSDPVLSGYVKSFSIGGIDVSRKLFPFIAVETPSNDADALTIGRDGYMNNVYTIRIFGGTYHTLADVAHAGSGKSGAKGILQLNSDILNAVIPNSFDDAFARPVRLLNSTTAHKVSSGGRSWITLVTISGRRKTLKQPA